MAIDWDYAELSKAAKVEGGPREYINKLEQYSRDMGRMEVIPWIGIAAVGASLLTLATIKMVASFKLKKQRADKEIEMAKQKLLTV